MSKEIAEQCRIAIDDSRHHIVDRTEHLVGVLDAISGTRKALILPRGRNACEQKEKDGDRE